MAFIVTILIVAAFSYFSIGLIPAIVFGVLVLASMLLGPLILTMILSLLIYPFTSKNGTLSEVAGFRQANARGRKIGFTAQFIVYAALVIIGARVGVWAMVGVITALLFKLTIDFFMGDLPFQQPKDLRNL